MITLRSVHKKYKKPVLTDVTHSFPSGSVSFLMGPNGSGKTTLFKCILGLEDHIGDVLFDGHPLEQVRDLVVPVFDETPFYSHLSGRRNLELLTDRRLSTTDVREAWTLGGDIDPGILDRPVKNYSSGQRKRLAVYLALVCHARYLLMDEVASGLDLSSMDAVVIAIKELMPDVTVVMSGHQFDFYARIVDQVAILVNGSLRTVELDDMSAGSLEATCRSLLRPRQE